MSKSVFKSCLAAEGRGSHRPGVLPLAALAVLLCLAALVPTVRAEEPQPDNAAETWRITSLDWPPYSGPELPGQGTAVQTLRQTLARAGIGLKVDFFPWARALLMARRPEYVGAFPSWPEEVGEGFAPSPPVAWSCIAVMTYEGSGLVWRGLDRLFDVHVGMVKTYVYPEEILALAEANPRTYSPAPNEMSLASMLSKKRFQAAITDPEVMRLVAEQNGITNIRVLADLGRHPLVLAFRKSPDNLRRLDLLKTLLKKESEGNTTAD